MLKNRIKQPLACTRHYCFLFSNKNYFLNHIFVNKTTRVISALVEANFSDDEVGSLMFVFRLLKSKKLFSLGFGSTSAKTKEKIKEIFLLKKMYVPAGSVKK